MRNQNTKKLVLAAVLTALGVAASPLYIPIGASKCFPVQHLVNVLAAVLLGPWYGVSMAFVTSLLRVLIGTGSLLAFPGSMCGALLAGLLYRWRPNLGLACLGEMIGTGVISVILAWPIAIFVLGKACGPFTYFVPFMAAAVTGVIIATVLVFLLRKSGAMNAMERLAEKG